MSGSALHPAIAGVYFAPALVWAIVAHVYWRFLRTRKPPGRFFSIAVALSAVVSCFYVLQALTTLIESQLPEHPLLAIFGLFALLSVIAIGAVFQDMIGTMPIAPADEEATGRLRPAVIYGSAGLVGAIVLLPISRLPPTTSPAWTVSVTIALAYLLLMAGVAIVRIRGRVRGGPLRIGSLLGGRFHSSDAAILVIVCLLLLACLALLLPGAENLETLKHPMIAGIGLLGAVPFALRTLNLLLREFLLAVAAIDAVGTVYLGVRTVSTTVESAVFRQLLDLGAVLVLVVILGPGRSLLEVAVDRVLLRQSRLWREQLQAFLRTLSPELGEVECARRASNEVARILQLPGAAIVFDDGRAVSQGDFDLEPLRRAWSSAAKDEDLPTHPFAWPWLRQERLREALAEANVPLVVPITSPHRRWGHLFLSTGLMGLREEGAAEALETFADQLALVLDGADLLARAREVERSLAHAEKLAAIGETAARIAHEIRNPVTAARSLAQQLAREPGTPFAPELGVILAELERVEHQVAALLRFARREELRFERVDLGQVLRATIEDLRPRLETAGIELWVEEPGGLMIGGDREKLRQVLINLIENAIDALRVASGRRRIALTVGGAGGTATLRITDSGTGAPAEALPHLFDPFFSLKEHGTGLGLSIVKRIVEAHGGKVGARSKPGEGLTVEIELPLAGVGWNREEGRAAVHA